MVAGAVLLSKKDTKINKIQFSHTFFRSLFLRCSEHWVGEQREFWEFRPLRHTVVVKYIDKKRGTKNACGPERDLAFFVLRQSKKCLTHLELLRELDEGGASIYLQLPPSKKCILGQYSMHTTFFCSWRPCGDLIPQKIYKNGHSKKQVMFLYKSGSCLRIVWIFHAVQLQGHNNKDKWLHNNKAYCFLSPSTLLKSQKVISKE